MYSLLHLDIGLLRDNLKSVEDEQNRCMNSLKLQNKKVNDAIARLEILAAIVNDYSRLESSGEVQSGTSSKSESVKVLEKEKSQRQFVSGKMRDDGVIRGFLRDSVASEDNNRNESNTVDTCIKELSTSRPSLANKRAKNKEVTNDDLITGAHHHLLSPNKATHDEYPHSSPSPVFQGKGCHNSTNQHGGTDVADKVVETMVLTATDTGTIIGRQGTTVNKLRKISGARISVSNLRGAAEGKAVIEGRVDQVKKAMEMIKEIMEGTVLARMTYSSILNLKSFIGEKGCKIRELERSTNTVISLNHTGRDQIIVKGLRDEVLKAMEIIQQVTGVGEHVLDWM